MKKIFFKHTVTFCFLLWGVSTSVFFLIHLIPGDPVTAVLGEGADLADILQFRSQLGLDKSLLHQYVDFNKNLFNLSFGESLFDHRPVLGTIITYFPNTFYLAVVSFLMALVLSLPLGAWAGLKGDIQPVPGTLATLFSSAALALPNFVLGPVLVLIFAVKLKWLPIFGSGDFLSIILPALTLGISVSAVLIPIVRTSIREEMKKPYILLARARGLTEFTVFRRHLLKNSMIPIVTALGMQVGALLCGAVVTETIFSWHGIGSLLVDAIHRRDYPMIQGIVIFITFISLAVNYFVEITYGWLDPRVRVKPVRCDSN